MHKPSSYPSIEAVNAADREQLCSWWRFLPSPGAEALGRTNEEFQKTLDAQVPIMNRIAERFKEAGGFTPEISKRLGWGGADK